MAGCKNNGIDHVARGKGLNEFIDKWKADKNITVMTENDPKFLKSFYETVTQLDFDYGRLPTLKELKKLHIKFNRMQKGIRKKPGKFAEWLYLPENILSKNPLTKRHFDSMIITGNFYRGTLEMFTSDVDQMARMIRSGARESGVMNKFKLNRSSAQKQIKKMENEYHALQVTDPSKAEKYYIEHLETLERNSEMKIVQGVYDLITDPKKLYVDKGNSGLSERYGTTAVQIANIWTGGSNSGQYTLRNGKKAGMRDKLFEILEDSLKVYTNMLESHANITGATKSTEKKVKQLLDQFQKQPNYYPTQALSIFPTLNKMSELIYSSNTSKELERTLPSIDKMIDSVIADLNVNPSTFASSGASKRRSKDVIGVIDTYAKDVIRFNYNTHSTNNVIKALRDLSNMKNNTDLKEQADFLARYITETHSTIVGTKKKNSKFAHLAKTITSWQFMQKIGLSPTTVVKNATQSLQNYVYFGGKTWYDSMQYSKSNKIGSEIESAMKEHGVFFVNLEEIADVGKMVENIQIIDGKTVHHEPGFNEWFSSTVEKAAKMTGKPMQWVENKVNRALTFKIAYSKMHQDLSNNHSLIRKRMNVENIPKDSIEDAVSREISKRSSRFAANMVKELHYEYSPFAKPKVLQTTTGSILGQFSTYGINFFEYNRKIASEFTDSAMAGDWNSQEAWRAYRMSSMYMFMLPMLEVATNSKWSNLIQHDTKDRLMDLYTWFTGSEKERKKTFFGKGPILGTFGGPAVGDLITLGNVIGMSKLTDGEMMSYLKGYQSKAKDDKRMQDAVGLLNLQLSRLIFSSMPKAINGTGFMTILNQDYLRLWNSPELKARREKMLLYPQKYGPKALKSYFTTSEQKELQDARRKRAWGKKVGKIQTKKISKENALSSLDLLENYYR